MPAPLSREQQEAQRARRRAQFESRMAAMGAEHVRARLSSFKNEEYAWARAFLGQAAEKEGFEAEAEAKRRERAEKRDELRLLIMWLSLAVSVLALAISGVALWRS